MVWDGLDLLSNEIIGGTEVEKLPGWEAGWKSRRSLQAGSLRTFCKLEACTTFGSRGWGPGRIPGGHLQVENQHYVAGLMPQVH